MKEYSLRQLSHGLNKGQWSSVDLIQMYLKRINQYDHSGPKINAIAEVNPDLYQWAYLLDEERKSKGPRSIIHGIPIIIKDNIMTKDKMHTSASSIVLEDFYGPEDAFIIKKLRHAGAIILGKANLSEFAYFMSFDDMPSGFGGRSGQVKSPYSKNIDPLGSSTGSAVSVACNFIPVSIGTETNGSLTAPALMNSIQTIKPTMGMVSRSGIIPISHHQDIAGPMARTIDDLAIVMSIIHGYDDQDLSTHAIKERQFNFLKATDLSVENKRLAFIRFTNMDYTDEEKHIEEEAKIIYQNAGVETIDLEIESKHIPNFDTLIYDFKVDLNHFMDQYMKDYKVHSLKEIIEFNQADPDKRMHYGQSIFEAADQTSGTLTESAYHEKYQNNLDLAMLITKTMNTHKLDGCISVKRTGYAPIAGNPVVAMVAKALVDDQPRSLYIIGNHFEDEIILALANLYEQATNKRIAPNLDDLR
ncbi:MAG TPA: amidase family protein [Candidatus Izemoplasmatales bacterium]|nr:amidase family protein [Candidatus Izemoplasmatales bacterium]